MTSTPGLSPSDLVVHHEPEGCNFGGRPHTGPCVPYGPRIDPALIACWVCGEPGEQEYQSSPGLKCRACDVTWGAERPREEFLHEHR